MSTAEILLLGAIAGCTIFIGLPVARLRNVSPSLRSMLAAVATGILIFLLWDVLSAAVEPVEGALTAGHDGRFFWLTALLTLGFGVGLLSLVYYDAWMKARRRKAFLLGPGAASPAELEQDYHFAGLSPAKWLAVFIATGIGLHKFSEGLAIGQSAGRAEPRPRAPRPWGGGARGSEGGAARDALPPPFFLVHRLCAPQRHRRLRHLRAA